MLLGCVADDATGATDLADALTTAGLRTELLLGLPAGEAQSSADAVVVALKSRATPAGEAIEASLAAWRWLARAGAERCFFKVCSTFDSTDAGNIGPVAEALAAELGVVTQLVCPAFPANGRTVYLGHLFVGTMLLSDSPMRHHPLTPMTDANLVAVLARQSRLAVGLVPLAVVRAGVDAVVAAAEEAGMGRGHLIADAVSDGDVATLGRAIVEGGHRLAAGGSAFGGAIAAGLAGASSVPAPASIQRSGPAVVLSGSCSQATQDQVARWTGLVERLDPLALPASLEATIGRVVAAVARGDAILVASTAIPEEVAAVQQRLGVQGASALVEQAFGALAAAAVAAGARRLVVAGGETAGAVAAALAITRLAVGPTISTGVPWTVATERDGLELALKSGNFGGPNFFTEALGL